MTMASESNLSLGPDAVRWSQSSAVFRSDPLEGFDEPLVDVDEEFLAEEQLALLLDEHRMPLIFAHLQLVALVERFGEETNGFLHLFAVDLDHGAAEQLVEIELDVVLFRFTDFKRKSHTPPVTQPSCQCSQLHEKLWPSGGRAPAPSKPRPVVAG